MKIGLHTITLWQCLGIVFVYYQWLQICIPEGFGLEYVVKEMATYIEALISQSKI